jgi:hypothetical protein
VTEPDPRPQIPDAVRHAALQAVVGEVEAHVAEAGWDQPPHLFALVETDALLAAEPQLAETMGIVGGNPGALTPIEQDDLGDLPLDEALARIEFGEQVLGVVLTQEVVVLPPEAEAVIDDPEAAVAHPQARDVRMVVGVLRGGAQAAVLRLRGASDAEDERVTGPDLAPALADALHATLVPGSRRL